MNKIVRVAVHALIIKDGKYLITRRAKINDYMPLFWDIPGGTIEFGEDIATALNREVQEETNLKIKINNIILAYGFQSGENRHQFQLVYACDYLSGDVELSPSEHDQFRWVNFNELENLKKIDFLKKVVKLHEN